MKLKDVLIIALLAAILVIQVIPGKPVNLNPFKEIHDEEIMLLQDNLDEAKQKTDYWKTKYYEKDSIIIDADKPQLRALSSDFLNRVNNRKSP